MRSPPKAAISVASIEPAGPTQTGPSSDPALPTSLNRPHRRRARRSWCGSLVSPTRSVRSASGRTLSTPRPRSLRAGPWFSCSSRILSPCGQYENARFAPRRAAKRTRRLPRDDRLLQTSRPALPLHERRSSRSGTESSQTLRWREKDSNLWYRGTKAVRGIAGVTGRGPRLLVDGTPETHPLAGDPSNHFVQVPSSARAGRPPQSPCGNHITIWQYDVLRGSLGADSLCNYRTPAVPVVAPDSSGGGPNGRRSGVTRTLVVNLYG